MVAISTSDLCRLAAEIVHDHGDEAVEYARRAVACFEAEGAEDRVRFWMTLSVLLDDIVEKRLNPDRAITIH